MMGRLSHDQEQFFYSFRLDEAVPDDHPVRKIAAVLDLSWVVPVGFPRGQRLAKSCCSPGRSRFDIARVTKDGVQRVALELIVQVPCVDGSELARAFFTFAGLSVRPCVRPISAAHEAAGHNALRGSGPGQKLAFDNAVALVGCPDRRIDRLCITCCLPFQPSHHAGMADVISFTLPVR
jgi:hypothetical protein